MYKKCTRSIWGNYKTLVNEMREELNKWRDTPCSWIRLNIVKMSVLPNLPHPFVYILSILMESSWQQKRKISHELITGEAVGIWRILILAILVILCVCV